MLLKSKGQCRKKPKHALKRLPTAWHTVQPGLGLGSNVGRFSLGGVPVQILQTLGVNFGTLIGFLVANLVSWMAADYLIQKLYKRRFSEIVETNPDQTLRDAQAKSEAWRNKLDLEFGRRIGRIERVFYIYAVMLGQFSLLSAWVIMKAFYGWIQKPNVAQSAAPDEDKEITTYYAYIYGNALSLLAALTLGHFGVLVANAWNAWLP